MLAPIGTGIDHFVGERAMQISAPRDIGPLVLVVGLFLILFAVALLVGAPG
jgi:uncharacterized membrane protein